MGDDPWGEQSYGEKDISRSKADATDYLFLYDTVTTNVEMNGPYGGLHESNPLLLGERIGRDFDLVRRN